MKAVGRREFLRRAALLALALPGAGAVATACSAGRRATAPAPTPLVLPLHEELAVASDLPIERDTTLRIYEWKNYLARRVLRSFEHVHAKLGIRVEVESFQHIDEAVARLRSPGADFDVVFPVIDVLADMVDEGMLRPLNHEYLPHLGNLWSYFRGAGPFYDPGQRYTVPYTVYTSGVGWRADLVDAADALDRRNDPFEIFLDRRYRGRVGFLDAYREALALGLQREGVADLRAATDPELAAAARFLDEAVRAAGARFTIDGAIEGLVEGRFAVHEAWSGDLLAAPRYAMWDGGDAAAMSESLRYWSPPASARVVGLDLMAIGARGRNPVAAHAFLDHLLTLDVALENFTWNGYQVPMTEASPEAFADATFRWHDCVPPALFPALVSERDFAAGQMLVGFTPSQDARWLAQWSRVAPS